MLLGGPEGTVATDSATFTFEATVQGATFVCALDSAPAASCQSPHPLAALADGEHAFAVQALAADGGVDPTPATRTWTVDTRPPETSWSSPPSGTLYQDSVTASGFTADEPVDHFECRLDAEPYAPCSSPWLLTALAEGPHTLSVRAVDRVLNVDPTPAETAFVVDTVLPDTTIVSGPASLTNSASAAVAFSSTRGDSTFECSLDGAAYAACASPASFTAPEGARRFLVRAVSPPGTDPSPAEHTWTVDLTAPQTRLVSAPTGTVYRGDATVEFDADEPVSGFECSLDGAAFAACASPRTLSGLADGPHTFQVRAIDLAQNVDASPAEASWTVDTALPDTTIESGPSGTTNNANAAFSFSSDRAGATFECRLGAAAFVACASPQSYTLSSGSYTFSVRALFATGADASPATRGFTIDTLAPETRIDSGPVPVTNAATAVFTFSATETSTYACDLDGGGYAACSAPHSVSVAAGAHTFSVRATDLAGNPDPSPATWSWTMDPAATSVRIRLMAANTTSGNHQHYEPPGTRIFQALQPDVALLQEFNVDSRTDDGDTFYWPDRRAWVDEAFGTGYQFYVESEPSDSIPNGIVSRYPILAAGEWADTLRTSTGGGAGTNRDYAWARIDIPGSKDLWVVSLHLYSGSASTTDGRAGEAAEVVSRIQAAIPAGDYLVVGGDFNTDTRGEVCITNFSAVVLTAPYPVDQLNNGNTNASRAKPYDWLLADPDLDPLETPVTIGSASFPNGLVFDSRAYTPLTDVAPVVFGDSAAVNMQHMAVVRDFLVPTP